MQSTSTMSLSERFAAVQQAASRQQRSGSVGQQTVRRALQKTNERSQRRAQQRVQERRGGALEQHPAEGLRPTGRRNRNRFNTVRGGANRAAARLLGGRAGGRRRRGAVPRYQAGAGFRFAGARIAPGRIGRRQNQRRRQADEVPRFTVVKPSTSGSRRRGARRNNMALEPMHQVRRPRSGKAAIFGTRLRGAGNFQRRGGNRVGARGNGRVRLTGGRARNNRQQGNRPQKRGNSKRQPASQRNRSKGKGAQAKKGGKKADFPSTSKEDLDAALDKLMGRDGVQSLEEQLE
eukprot:NODE_5071_length_987_cov_42.900463_g4862_i0.p1 GENE.NODE_5071_length_987_cov_42.900463_g4862_i0~~NODE_5071_length_987_cov_42.900463_g4862_i0.p1  ORF type:complete len:307 (-),score=66.37 NODE_5071_length_987_cov_42.900463_g4862_i0:65-937(-)